MRNLFTFSSRLVFPLLESSDSLVEKMVLGLKNEISKHSGDGASRNGNQIYFIVYPDKTQSTFIGIDSGELVINVQDNKMIVEYRLSYLSPFVQFLLLDIFLVWLSFMFPSQSEVGAFAVIVTGLLLLYIMFTVITILTFPGIIYSVWDSINGRNRLSFPS